MKDEKTPRGRGAVLYFILQTSHFILSRLAIERGANSNCEVRGGLNVVLGLVVAGFAAVEAVILSVFGEPDAVARVAKGAVLYALAAFFRLAAGTTVKDFSGHDRVLLPARPAMGRPVRQRAGHCINRAPSRGAPMLFIGRSDARP